MTSSTDTPVFAQETPTVVLQVAGEGGGYVIEGVLEAGRWRFRRRPGHTTQFFGVDDVQLGDCAWKDSFDAALQQINCSWPALTPICVHEVFFDAIWQLVMRFHEREPLRVERLQQWREVCSKADH